MSFGGIVLIVIIGVFGIIMIGAIIELFTEVGRVFEEFFKSPVSVIVFVVTVVTLLAISHYVLRWF
ncbi:hypothetical protein [Helicobacter suis]|uniref:hypothetical protein n=1 Tax=Helicobacter suis TaxID=104628 RepID=UPI0013D89C9F|nr:hypothetical protein [Helicobacter suis]